MYNVLNATFWRCRWAITHFTYRSVFLGTSLLCYDLILYSYIAVSSCPLCEISGCLHYLILQVGNREDRAEKDKTAAMGNCWRVIHKREKQTWMSSVMGTSSVDVPCNVLEMV